MEATSAQENREEGRQLVRRAVVAGSFCRWCRAVGIGSDRSGVEGQAEASAGCGGAGGAGSAV